MTAGTVPARHPYLAPAHRIFETLGIDADPTALVIMASGVRYVDAAAGDLAGMSLDAAFDLFEAAGFNCEQFRSVDPEMFLRAARREHDLAARRWQAVPLWSFWREEGADAVAPVALSEFDAHSVRVTSAAGDRRVGIDEFTAAEQALWGYAAPVPSLRAIVSPTAFELSSRAVRSLRILRNRMSVARDGLPVLEAFVETQPIRRRLDVYRARMIAASAEDPAFSRGILVDAIDRFGHGALAREDFAASAALHAEFQAGDDGALAEIAVVERRGLALERWSAAA